MSYYTVTFLVGVHRFGVSFPELQTFSEIFWALHTPFLFYKNSFYKNHEGENRPKIKNFVRTTPGSRSRDL